MPCRGLSQFLQLKLVEPAFFCSVFFSKWCVFQKFLGAIYVIFFYLKTLIKKTSVLLYLSVWYCSTVTLLYSYIKPTRSHFCTLTFTLHCQTFVLSHLHYTVTLLYSHIKYCSIWTLHCHTSGLQRNCFCTTHFSLLGLNFNTPLLHNDLQKSYKDSLLYINLN